MAEVFALSIKLLGHFEVWRHDELLDKNAWPQPKVQALLKVLLVERGQVYSHDQLIEALFADLDPSKATINLQRRVSELRAVLEPHLKKKTESQYILRLGQGYCFSKEADCWIDVEAFEKLATTAKSSEADENWAEALSIYQQAIDLYQGDYLAPLQKMMRSQQRASFWLRRLSCRYRTDGLSGGSLPIAPVHTARD